VQPERDPAARRGHVELLAQRDEAHARALKLLQGEQRHDLRAREAIQLIHGDQVERAGQRRAQHLEEDGPLGKFLTFGAPGGLDEVLDLPAHTVAEQLARLVFERLALHGDRPAVVLHDRRVPAVGGDTQGARARGDGALASGGERGQAGALAR
jgi:hypothetical protein